MIKVYNGKQIKKFIQTTSCSRLIRNCFFSTRQVIIITDGEIEDNKTLITTDYDEINNTIINDHLYTYNILDNGDFKIEEVQLFIDLIINY